MQIANPIYDSVFKYLLDDKEAAKLLISTIIMQDIVDIDFLPDENIVDIEKKSFTVYRLDFKATIKTKQGLKLIIIEIQKAKFASDILRFRKYLGEQYIKNGTIPIISIYFLGYTLDYIKAPVIKVNRHYTDITTGELIKEREEFIESLTHDSFVIQIGYLKKESQSEVEQLLEVFDQTLKSTDTHLLNFVEAEYPKKFSLLLRRLLRAAAEPEIRKKMDIEDQIVSELESLERTIEDNKKIIEEKDKKLEEKNKKLKEKDREIEELNKKLAEATKKLASKR